MLKIKISFENIDLSYNCINTYIYLIPYTKYYITIVAYYSNAIFNEPCSLSYKKCLEIWQLINGFNMRRNLQRKRNI